MFRVTTWSAKAEAASSFCFIQHYQAFPPLMVLTPSYIHSPALSISKPLPPLLATLPPSLPPSQLSVDLQVQIHESNKGFQLLAGMGWNLDEGLGARKQGRVNPLQTTFKRGTTGLGAGEKLRPRVTHFPSHVHSQALNAPDGKSDAVRAHESLDRRRGRRNTDRHSKSGDGGGGASGVVSEAPRPSSRESSSSSWSGFWGQGTHSGSSGGTGGGGSSSGVGKSGSSRKGRGGGGGGRGGDRGREGEGSFLSRKEREVQMERERRKERRTRFELFSDVPEEYAALFT